MFIGIRSGAISLRFALVIATARSRPARTIGIRLGPLAISFRERLNAKRGVVRAKVTTAAPLGPAQVEALSTRLAALTGRQVQLSAKVDPSIIGGVVTQVGSTVYDGSVTSQLARMRRKLVENV